MNKKKTNQSGIHVGTSLILVTFVLLSLVTFAVLSLASAKADHKLTSAFAERTTQYYEANNEALQTLVAANDILTRCYDEASDEKDYFTRLEKEISTDSSFTLSTEDGTPILSYETPINDHGLLSVSILLCYPSSSTEELYKIRTWQTVTTLDPEEDMPLKKKSGLLF